MEQKKPTKAQIENRIKNAIVFVPRTKDTKSIYFNDKGLRLSIDNDYAIVETGFHRHVFNRITSIGESRPYLYVGRFIDITLENDCKVKNADGQEVNSYAKLFDVLKKKGDANKDYNVAWYIDKWLYNIFSSLYSIGESEAEMFSVYEEYLHFVAKNALLLSEKKEPMTNRQFIDGIIKNIQDYTSDLEERVLFEAKTDEQLLQEEADAIHEHEMNESIKESANG